MDREELLIKVNKLIQLHQQGLLGGEKMPEGTAWKPIDVHTPMWLWSRGKFEIDI